GAKRTFENFLRLRIKLRNVERAARNAVTTAYAVLLLKINYTVLVLDDCAIRRARAQTTRISAVHTLIFTHQPHEVAIAFVLYELNQVVVVPLGRGHRLVSVIESRFAERMIVPLYTSHLASLAADAGRHVNIFGNLDLALRS